MAIFGHQQGQCPLISTKNKNSLESPCDISFSKVLIINELLKKDKISKKNKNSLITKKFFLKSDL
jgi:hypothetical protein